jgi:hypothetical protein
MDEQEPTDPQPQRSNFWLVFSSLCVAGSILASMYAMSAAQRYKAQQQQYNRQQQEQNIKNYFDQRP